MATNKEIAGACVLMVVACFATGGTVYKVTSDLAAQYTKLDEKITKNHDEMKDLISPMVTRITVIEDRIKRVSDGCGPMRPQTLLDAQ